ncbi:ribonuclease H-like domain-containing protein [Tanacetum coccineum]
MANCNPSQTHVDTESKLGDDGDPVFDSTFYRSLAGSLPYPTSTRLDFPMQFNRYVRGTLDHGLQLFLSFTTYLVAYSDVDWAGYPTTWRSTSGYYVFLSNNLLSWSFKLQPTLSRSSAEAEYRGVANAVVETVGWEIYYCADIFTKGLPSTLFEEFCTSLSIRCLPVPTAGEC